MQRRFFLQSLVAGASAAFLSRSLFAGDPLAPNTVEEGTKWFNMENLELEGRAWLGEERIAPYDRFPKRWMEKVTDAVRGNATHSAGTAVRFRTNADDIWIRYELTSPYLAMFHMPATGKSGFDLYGRDTDGTLRFLSLTQKGEKAEALMTQSMTGNVEREYLLYLPLYNGVKSLEIGVPEENTFEMVNRPEKPLLIYGTSISHGGCASRPGMAYPAILGRRFDLPHWNFGFSGAAKMEIDLADAFAELDACAYVLDPMPNMTPALVNERFYPFVKRLREKRPDTPIVLVEDRIMPSSWAVESRREFHQANHAAMRAQYERLLADGVQGLYTIAGEKVLPPDGDGTVEDSHLSDYGFWWQANAVEPVLREAIGK